VLIINPRLPAGARAHCSCALVFAAAVDARGQSSVRLNEVLANNVSLTNVGGTVTDGSNWPTLPERSLISPTRA